MTTKNKKQNFAREQLEDGIRLFLEKRYISAITLLGAATEILSNLYQERRGIDVLHEEQKRLNVLRSYLGTPHISKRELQRINRQAYNIVKHHDQGDPEIVSFNRFGEAFMQIQKAVYYANQLGLKFKFKRKYDLWLKRVIISKFEKD